MAMTMTQKILAAHAGMDKVEAGELILVDLDRVLGNDITSPVAINEFNKAGFDGVFDVDTAADITIMEEGTELLSRIQNGGTLPMITSCSPGWINYAEYNYGDLLDHLSSCKSPHEMFGAVIKSYYAEREGIDPSKIVSVSIMPCTAKKYEIHREDQLLDGEMATDHSITTVELADMIRSAGLRFEDVLPEAVEMPFGIASGAGVIFGVTGGVTEAVLRRLADGHDSATLDAIAKCGIRGEEGIKEAVVPYNGIDVKICVVSGLANARKVMEQVQSGEKEYHLIEVMACRRGCIMGGGQPIPAGPRHKAARAAGLYSADGSMVIKKSDENPLMDVFYNGYFKGKAHELLHNHK